MDVGADLSFPTCEELVDKKLAEVAYVPLAKQGPTRPAATPISATFCTVGAATPSQRDRVFRLPRVGVGGLRGGGVIWQPGRWPGILGRPRIPSIASVIVPRSRAPSAIVGLTFKEFAPWYRLRYPFTMAALQDLLAALDRRDPVAAGDLLRVLDVSPATLSRLVAAAGEEVVRLGRARATQYGRTRVVENVGRNASLFRVDATGEARETGRITFLRGGASWVEERGRATLYAGLPPALADMAPQGYLGRGFSARFPELGLPPYVTHWTDDHRLRALALRGEDTVGNLIVGESVGRFLAWSPPSTTPAAYPALAERAALGDVGSSAGGERPKFGTLAGDRHVLVKFAPPGVSPTARRWRDLLWCEYHALRTLEGAGVAAAAATCRDVDGWRFLEIERFDRAGVRGRRAVVSLEAIDNEHFGLKDSWTAAAGRLRAAPFSLPENDASRLRWLEAFGQLIGNDDRHFGNITFFVEPSGALQLAPAYDMLPMILAPSAEKIVERQYTPQPPVAASLPEWKAAAPLALRYWRDLAAKRALDESLRLRARSAAAALEQMVRRVMPGVAIDRPGRRRGLDR